jgi:hypothetical protein
MTPLSTLCIRRGEGALPDAHDGDQALRDVARVEGEVAEQPVSRACPQELVENGGAGSVGTSSSIGVLTTRNDPREVVTDLQARYSASTRASARYSPAPTLACPRPASATGSSGGSRPRSALEEAARQLAT